MTEKTLFETVGEPEVIVLSSNFSIYPLLSRGCLFPPAHELSDEYDFPIPHGTSFVTFEAAVPETVVSSMEAVARNLLPIGIVLHAGELPMADCRTIDCITLDRVERLVFRTEKELKRFKLSPFADVDIEAIELEMVVDPDAFAGRTDEATSASVVEADAVRADADAIRISDAYAGLCCSLLAYVPGKSSWFDMLVRLLSAEVSSTADREMENIATVAGACLQGTEASVSKWENKLLLTASRELLSLNPKEGWAAKQILSKIAESASQHMSDSERAEGLSLVRSWAELTTRVLDDEATLPPLSDDGSLILRALTLLLVRGTTESLLALRERQREERVGPKVWRLSFALASLHEGLRSMPKELKYSGGPEIARKRIEVLGSAARLCLEKLDGTSGSVETPSLAVREVQLDGQSTIELRSGDITIAASAVEIHPALRKAANDCRYYGFDVDKLGAEHFEVSSGLEQSLQGTVQVSVWNDPASGSEVLRFKSTARALKTTAAGAKKGPVEFLAKNNQLSKAELLEMLISNADVSQNCRLALQTEPLAIVVLVDQMLDTMDRDECVAHLRNVSRKAAELSEGIA